MRKFPLVNKSTTSKENVEKVVNELKIPVIKNSLIPLLIGPKL